MRLKTEESAVAFLLQHLLIIVFIARRSGDPVR